MRENKIQYNPKLSIKQNATKCGVSDDVIRNYIKNNSIDRRSERKKNIIEDCRKYLKRHPDATREELHRETGYSLKTIRRYWDFITSSDKVIPFSIRKLKSIQDIKKKKEQELIDYLNTIPIEFLKKYIKNREENPPEESVQDKPKVEETTILDGIPFKPFEEFFIPVSDCIQFHSKALPENKVLSNHYECIITFRGVEFYGLEQLYAALDFSDSPDVLKRIMKCKNGKAAKKLCHEKYLEKRDWDFDFKRYRMIALCHLFKYLSVKEYRDRLRDTYPQTLVECPNGRDYHYGMVQNLDTNIFEGNNCSGRTSMIVRDMMKEKEDSAISEKEKNIGRQLSEEEKEEVRLAIYADVRYQFEHDKQVIKDSKPLFSFIEKNQVPKVRKPHPKSIEVPVIDKKTKCLVVGFDYAVFDTSADDAYRKCGGEKDWDKIYGLIPQYRLYEGWQEVFQWTKKNKVKIAVLASAKRELIEAAFKYFKLPCNTVVGYQPYLEMPNTILGNMLMEKLNIRQNQIIYVGCNEDDDKQARSSQFRFIGAVWHPTNHEDYFKNRRIQTISNPKELIQIMEDAGWNSK